MIDPRHDPTDDQLSQACEALKTEKFAPDPPTSVVATTLHRLESEEVDRRQVTRGASIPKVIRYASLAAASLVLAIGVVSVVGVGSAARTAFAQVQQTMDDIRSVQYMETHVSPGEDGTRKFRVMILGRYLQRREQLDDEGKIDHIFITNARTGESVSIDPQKRVFQNTTKQVTIDMATGNRTETEVKARPEVDFYRRIRNFKYDPSLEPLRRQIGDRPAIGFRYKSLVEYEDEKYGSSTFTHTMWVDEQTKLPVRMENSVENTYDKFADSSEFYDDFVFDEELDETLFSTEPPDGYEVKQGSITGLTVRQNVIEPEQPRVEYSME